MKKDAELHAAEDKKKQEMIEVKNLAEQVVYTAEKTLADAKEKVNAEMKTEAEAKISALKEVLKTENTEDIKTKTKELSEVMQKIGAELNKAGATPPPAGEEPKKDEPKAEEGEFKEKE